MAISRFSFSFLCPVKSASRRGRRPTSNCRSSAWRFPETSSRSGMCYQLTVATRDRVEKPLGDSRSADRGQTGLTANFRQTAPEIHVSLVSPRGGGSGRAVFHEVSRAERPSQQYP